MVLRRDAHDRNRRLIELVQDDRMIAQWGQQNNALQPQLPEQGIDLLVDVGTFHIPWLDHQVNAGFPAAFNRAGLKFAQIVPRPFTKKPDQKRPVARQSAGIEIGPVIELLDGLQNPRAGIGANPRFIVDDARHGLGGDLREVGHFLNGDGRGSQSDGQCRNLGYLRLY